MPFSFSAEHSPLRSVQLSIELNINDFIFYVIQLDWTARDSLTMSAAK